MGRTDLRVAALLLVSVSGVPSVQAKSPAACQLGQVAVDVGGHCCWPGQRWDAARKACAGTPNDCPPGTRPIGEDCAVSGGPGRVKGKGPGKATGPDAISTLIWQNGGGLRLCFERAQRKNPNLFAVPTIRFTINQGGGVQGAKVSGAMDRGLTRCLTDTVKRWRFPPPPEGAVIISYSVSSDSTDSAPIDKTPLRR